MSYKEILEKAKHITHKNLEGDARNTYEYYLETQNVLISLAVSLQHNVDKGRVIEEFLKAGEE